MTVVKMYDSRWNRRAFLAQHPLCVMCLASEVVESATVVDHIVPHRLRFARTPEAIRTAQQRFWDKNNWQPLCARHHSTTKQRMEKSGKGYGCDERGLPNNPNSHWYRAERLHEGEGGAKVPS